MARGWDLAAIARGYLPNDPLSVPGIAMSIQSAPTGLPPQVIHCAAPPDTRPRRTAPEAPRLAPPRRASNARPWRPPPALRPARRRRVTRSPTGARCCASRTRSGRRRRESLAPPLRSPHSSLFLARSPPPVHRWPAVARALHGARCTAAATVTHAAGFSRWRRRVEPGRRLGAPAAPRCCASHFAVLRGHFDASCSRLQLRRWRGSHCGAVAVSRAGAGVGSEQRGRRVFCLRVPYVYA